MQSPDQSLGTALLFQHARTNAAMDSRGESAGTPVQPLPDTAEEQEEQNEGKEGIIEEKYLLPPDAVGPFIRCAREFLYPDPHTDSRLGDGYFVHSLYFDDEQFRTYHSSGLERLPKYRIRRYSDGDVVFLEKKSKPEGRVRKHRTPIPLDELPYLMSPEIPDGWQGRWFRKQIQNKCLRPVCNISYSRLARIGRIADQMVRFTLDREVLCAPANAIAVPGPLKANASVIGAVIAEIKFERTLPTPFAQVIADLGLEPCTVSKYKRGIEACLLAPALPEPPCEESPCGRSDGAF